MREIILAAAFLACAGSARAQSTATLRGIDIYRSAMLTEGVARQRYEDRLRQYVSLHNQHTPAKDAQAEALRREIEREAAATPGVAQVELHISEFFTSADHAMYAMFDVVDREDSSRLAFTPAPKAAIKDPDGLLAAWRRYMQTGEALSLRGQMPVDSPNCPGYYCLWGGTPEFDAMHAAFVKGAAENEDALRRVLRDDGDGEKRAAALYVLSYVRSAKTIIELCRNALLDSDMRVRGAALQILADIANRRPSLPVGLDRVLPRLDDPSSSVRGKTMGLLVPLAERKGYREVMLPAAPRLVELLRLRQPESRDLAYTLLGLLSRKNFDRREYKTWEAWAASAAAGRP